MDDLLKGVIDIHVHCAPDVVPRSVDDLLLAEQSQQAGMYGFVIKSHYTPTAARADTINKLYPDVRAFGSVTLNSSVGGINPMAVESAAVMGARVVWFPTFDSAGTLPKELDEDSHLVFMQSNVMRCGALNPAVPVLDDNGKLLPQIYPVLRIIAEHDMVLSSGHLSPQESYVLFRAAADMGVQRMVLTHADCPLYHYSVEEQLSYVKMGVMIEHSYINVLTGVIPLQQVYWEICAIGVDHVLCSTDMGQAQFVSPVEGMREYIKQLIRAGLTDSETDVIFRRNPQALLAL